MCQRERFLYAKENGNSNFLRNSVTYPVNDFDRDGICPDTAQGAELWDYDEIGSARD